ncbi:aldo/keto reductase [Acrocarpospora pleiomorpha]|uniref:Aldo/keto reductase n=1 Tax=Acrocarpospora pleiomorpha TaxID=90975 RepID=A0A5M3XCI4_9ACTN|nr:aldo/keto reductase [Acrocarpospora pleiomorpha]GES19375.1 aldo/keto reductase [Acrocarpospora pleiomorpha]
MRVIGTDRLPGIGLGCMGLSWAYADGIDTTEADKHALLDHALDRGIRLLDTSDFYGPHTNERLLGQVLRRRRTEAFISTKGGLVPAGDTFMGFDGRPEHLRAACDASLRRLGVDHIDLYQLHRVDPAVPLEDSWGALAELVAAGKARHIGLCEVDADQLEAAHRIHPVATVQSELSVWEKGALDAVLPWCREHGTAFIAFSPLGRGYLAGTITTGTTFTAGDFRASHPRFTVEARTENQRIVDTVTEVARRHGATPAQVAIAWLLAVDDRVIPIPGTTKRHRLDENLGALELHLDADDMTRLSSLAPPVQARY